jgi:DNA excision repair protein ERCC-3
MEACEAKEPRRENTGFWPENPLMVQSDHTLLLEVHKPRYEQARVAISAFAELEQSPAHIHTYRITPLSLWHAAVEGMPSTIRVDLARSRSFCQTVSP